MSTDEGEDQMCDHCGCQDFPLIAEFTEQHRRIQEASGLLRHAIGRGDHEEARRRLEALTALLKPHVAAEEQGLFVELRAEESIRVTVEQLCEEHARLEAELRGPSGEVPDWTRVSAALDLLAEHIYKEEYGVFPAAVVLLPTPVWDRITPSHAHVPTDAVAHLPPGSMSSLPE